MDYTVYSEQSELFAYFRKDNPSACQFFPIPDDLENYHKVPIEKESDIYGKRYDPELGELVDAVESRTVTVKKRKIAYKEQSDPLFMEWQYDQTPESYQAWRDAVAAIKDKYPFQQ